MSSRAANASGERFLTTPLAGPVNLFPTRAAAKYLLLSFKPYKYHVPAVAKFGSPSQIEISDPEIF